METLDPHDLAAYLNLLDLGDLGLELDLDLEHGIAGLVASLLGGAVDDDDDDSTTRGVWRELERSYRVRCGVSVQELWSWSRSRSSSSSSSRSSSSGGGGGGGGSKGEHVEFVRSMGSQMGCVQECERRAIGAARDGDVAECLGAAWSGRLERGNCRFWTGGRDEVLPVGRLKGGRGGSGIWCICRGETGMQVCVMVCDGVVWVMDWEKRGVLGMMFLICFYNTGFR